MMQALRERKGKLILIGVLAFLALIMVLSQIDANRISRSGHNSSSIVSQRPTPTVLIAYHSVQVTVQSRRPIQIDLALGLAFPGPASRHERGAIAIWHSHSLIAVWADHLAPVAVQSRHPTPIVIWNQHALVADEGRKVWYGRSPLVTLNGDPVISAIQTDHRAQVAVLISYPAQIAESGVDLWYGHTSGNIWNRHLQVAENSNHTWVGHHPPALIRNQHLQVAGSLGDVWHGHFALVATWVDYSTPAAIQPHHLTQIAGERGKMWSGHHTSIGVWHNRSAQVINGGENILYHPLKLAAMTHHSAPTTIWYNHWPRMGSLARHPLVANGGGGTSGTVTLRKKASGTVTQYILSKSREISGTITHRWLSGMVTMHCEAFGTVTKPTWPKAEETCGTVTDSIAEGR